MTSLYALWLPILASAVIAFIASSVIHMAPLWHKNDYPKVPDEDRVRDALRPLGIPPGDYMVPRAGSMQDMRSQTFLDKVNKGPVLILTMMRNGPISMAKNLTQWFIYLVIVSYFTAYIASRALAPGTDYMQVFQITGAVAFVGYTLALLQMSIWYHRSWSLSVKAIVDGLIYGLLTAGTFGWLWPAS